MEGLVALLPLLACPAGMGLMMWLMMRGRPQPATNTTGSGGAAPVAGNGQVAGHPARPGPALDRPEEPVGARRIAPGRQGGPAASRLSGLCLNWKVVAGLAAVALAIWIVVPGLVWAALPLLILAACPLSMLLVMRGMSGGQCVTQSAPAGQPASARAARLVELRAQQAAIAGEIVALESPPPAVRDTESAFHTAGLPGSTEARTTDTAGTAGTAGMARTDHAG